jgi:drug/metabolite transporter (DMT)-like permease
VAALVAAMTVWGSTFVVTETILEEVGSFAIAALRYGIGLVCLLPFAYRRGFRLRLALEPTFLLFFGLTGVALYYGLQNLALVYISAANAALISAGIPWAAALLALLFIKERIPRARLFGIALSVFGVLLVGGTVPSGGGSAALLGNALMVVAVVAYGAYASRAGP